MAIYKLKCPLRVPVTKKKDFILNLNNYRNTYRHTLNKSKIKYKELMQSQIEALPELVPPIMVKFVLYPETARLCDIANVCSIHEKYVCDAIVELGKLPDDNYNYLIESRYAFGAIDRKDPRVVMYIKDSKE